jgi:adenylylsulfate kinase-like enzyme
MRRTGVDAAVCSVGNRHDERDPKGLYEKADRGKVVNLTGRDQPYEVPEDPALVLRTAELTAEGAVDRVLELVLRA